MACVQGWLRVFSPMETAGVSDDVKRYRNPTLWTIRLATFNPAQLKLFLHESEEARASDAAFDKSIATTASWIGPSAAPIVAELAKQRSPSLFSIKRKSKAIELADDLPSQIQLEDADVYRLHRSLFSYDEGFKFVFAVKSSDRLLFKSRERLLMAQWLTALRQAVYANTAAGQIKPMLRRVAVDIESLSRHITRSRTSRADVFAIIMVQGFPEAVTTTKSLLDKVTVEQSFIFDWRNLSEHALENDVLLRVYTLRNQREKHQAEGALSCGSSSTGNFAQTSCSVRLPRTDKLKEMMVSVKVRQHLVILLPEMRTAPLFSWWLENGTLHFKKVYQALEHHFKESKHSSKMERLVCHYMHFLRLINSYRPCMAEEWIRQLVIHQLRADANSPEDMASFGSRNEDSSTLIVSYLALHCHTWLQDALGDLMLDVQKAADELGRCEVTIVNSNTAHEQRLIQLFRKLWDGLWHSRMSFPLKARNFFIELREAALSSDLAQNVKNDNYPLETLLRESARKHVFFRFLGGLVLSQPHLVGLLQSNCTHVMSTWLNKLSQALKRLESGKTSHGSAFEVFVSDFEAGHKEEIADLLRRFSGEDIKEAGAPHAVDCSYSPLAQSLLVPSLSAAVVAYDLQNVTSKLRGKDSLSPLVDILSPILDQCISVLNGTGGAVPRHHANQPSLSARPSEVEAMANALLPSLSAEDLSSDSRKASNSDSAAADLVAMLASDGISRLGTRHASSISTGSLGAETVRQISTELSNDGPTAYDLRELVVPRSNEKQQIKLRKQLQVVTDRYRQLHRVNLAALNYIDTLKDFIESQGYVPPSPEPVEEGDASLLEDDWSDADDSSAAAGSTAVKSARSACGPPVASDPVRAHTFRQAAPNSNINTRVMLPAKLPRRPVTTSTSGSNTSDTAQAEDGDSATVVGLSQRTSVDNMMVSIQSSVKPQEKSTSSTMV